MLGAMAGDVIGAAWEANTVKTTHFQLFPPGGLLHRRRCADRGVRRFESKTQRGRVRIAS